MPLYFESADLVVLPYRTLMSSSGPLSLAYSFSKPVILSSPLEELLLTKDMPETMQEAGITSEDLLFPLTSTFQEKLSALKKDNAKLRQLTAFSKALGEKRSWNEIGRMYADIFFAK